jgi:ribosomal protein S18 acetylase RimI-like enzyme
VHRPDEPVVEFRAARDADRAAVQALVDHDVAGTAYADVVRYFVRLALEGRREESRAIVAVLHDEVAGVALYGAVAGAVGTGRMHFVAVSASARLHGIGVGLCDAALSDMARDGARLVTAELPDDRVIHAGRVLLTRAGFSEVARVADYYRDGVDLVIVARAVDGVSDDTSAGST